MTAADDLKRKEDDDSGAAARPQVNMTGSVVSAGPFDAQQEGPGVEEEEEEGTFRLSTEEENSEERESCWSPVAKGGDGCSASRARPVKGGGKKSSTGSDSGGNGPPTEEHTVKQGDASAEEVDLTLRGDACKDNSWLEGDACVSSLCADWMKEKGETGGGGGGRRRRPDEGDGKDMVRQKGSEEEEGGVGDSLLQLTAGLAAKSSLGESRVARAEEGGGCNDDGGEDWAVVDIAKTTEVLSDLNRQRSPQQGRGGPVQQREEQRECAAAISDVKRTRSDDEPQSDGGSKKLVSSDPAISAEERQGSKDSCTVSSRSALPAPFDQLPFLISASSDLGPGGYSPHSEDAVSNMESRLALSAVPVFKNTMAKVSETPPASFSESSGVSPGVCGMSCSYGSVGGSVGGASRTKWVSPLSPAGATCDAADFSRRESLRVDQVPAALLDFLKEETPGSVRPPPGLSRAAGKLACGGDGGTAGSLPNPQEDGDVARLLHTFVPEASSRRSEHRQMQVNERGPPAARENSEKASCRSCLIAPPPPPTLPPVIPRTVCARGNTDSDDVLAKSEDSFTTEAQRPQPCTGSPSEASFLKADVIRALFDGGAVSSSALARPPPLSSPQHPQIQEGQVSGRSGAQGGPSLLEDASLVRLLQGEENDGRPSGSVSPTGQSRIIDTGIPGFFRQAPQAEQFQQQVVVEDGITGGRVVEAPYVGRTGFLTALCGPAQQEGGRQLLETEHALGAPPQQLPVHAEPRLAPLAAATAAGAGVAASGSEQLTNNNAKSRVPSTGGTGGFNAATGPTGNKCGYSNGDENPRLFFTSCGQRTGGRESAYQSAGLPDLPGGGSFTPGGAEPVSRRMAGQRGDGQSPGGRSGQRGWARGRSLEGAIAGGGEQPKSVNSPASSQLFLELHLPRKGGTEPGRSPVGGESISRDPPPAPPPPGFNMFPHGLVSSGGRDSAAVEKAIKGSVPGSSSSRQQQQQQPQVNAQQRRLGQLPPVRVAVRAETAQQCGAQQRQDQLVPSTRGSLTSPVVFPLDESAEARDPLQSQKVPQLPQAHQLLVRQTPELGHISSSRQPVFSAEAALDVLSEEIGSAKTRFVDGDRTDAVGLHSPVTSFDMLLLAEQLGRRAGDRQILSKIAGEQEDLSSREKLVEQHWEQYAGTKTRAHQPLVPSDRLVVKDKSYISPVQALLSAIQARECGSVERCGIAVKNLKGKVEQTADGAAACSEASPDQRRLIEAYRAILLKRFAAPAGGVTEAADTAKASGAGGRKTLRPQELDKHRNGVHSEPEGLCVHKLLALKGAALNGCSSVAESWRTPMMCLDFPSPGLSKRGAEGAASRRGLELFGDRVRGKKESPYGREGLFAGAAPVHTVCRRTFMWEKLTVQSLAHSPPALAGQSDSFPGFAGILSEGGRVVYCEEGIFAFGGRRGQHGELCNTVSWLRPDGSNAFCWVALPASGEAPPPCSGMIVLCAAAGAVPSSAEAPATLSRHPSQGGRPMAAAGEQNSSKRRDGLDVATTTCPKDSSLRESGKAIVEGEGAEGPGSGMTKTDRENGQEAPNDLAKNAGSGCGAAASREEDQGEKAVGQRKATAESTRGAGFAEGDGAKLLVYGGRSRDGAVDWNSLYSFDLTTHEWRRLSVDTSELFDPFLRDCTAMLPSDSLTSLSSASSLSSSDSGGQAVERESSQVSRVGNSAAKTEEAESLEPALVKHQQTPDEAQKREDQKKGRRVFASGKDRTMRRPMAVSPPPMHLQDSSWCYSPYDQSVYVFGGIGRQARPVLRVSAGVERARESWATVSTPRVEDASAPSSGPPLPREGGTPGGEQPSVVMCGSWECRNQLWRLDMKLLRWTEVVVCGQGENFDAGVVSSRGVAAASSDENDGDDQRDNSPACVPPRNPGLTSPGSIDNTPWSGKSSTSRGTDRGRSAASPVTDGADQAPFSWGSPNSVLAADSWASSGGSRTARGGALSGSNGDVSSEHVSWEYSGLERRSGVGGAEGRDRQPSVGTVERSGDRVGAAGDPSLCSSACKPDRVFAGGSTKGSSVPKGRAGHSCVYKDGRLWVFGGFNTQEELGDLFSFDIQGRYWSEVAPRAPQVAVDGRAGGGVSANGDRLARPSPRYGHGAVVIEESMFVFGGYGGKQSCLSDLWEFHFQSLRWSKVLVEGRIPLPRFRCCAAVYSGCLFVFEGRGSIQPSLPQSSTPSLHSAQGGASLGAAVDQAVPAAAPLSCKRSTVFTDAYRIHLSRSGASKAEGSLLSSATDFPTPAATEQMLPDGNIRDRGYSSQSVVGGIALSQQLPLQSCRGELQTPHASRERATCSDSVCGPPAPSQGTSIAAGQALAAVVPRAGDSCAGAVIDVNASVADLQAARERAQKKAVDVPRIVWGSGHRVNDTPAQADSKSDAVLDPQVLSELVAATRPSGKEVFSVAGRQVSLGQTRRVGALSRDEPSAGTSGNRVCGVVGTGIDKNWCLGEGRGAAGVGEFSKPVELCWQLHQKLKATKEAEEHQRQGKEAALALLGQYREIVQDLQQQLQAQPQRLQRMREEWAEEKEGLAVQVQRLSVALTDVYAKLWDVRKDMEYHHQREQKLNEEVEARDKVIAQQRRDVDALSTKYQQAQILFSRLFSDRNPAVPAAEKERGEATGSAVGATHHHHHHHTSVGAPEHFSRILSQRTSPDGKHHFQR